MSNAVGGWFGNNGGRAGNFGGGASGANNLDDRTNGAGNPLPSNVNDFANYSEQAHTFDPGNSDEEVVIDLTEGGASLEEIQGILADWVAGDNAGILLAGEFGNQAFFRSNGVATGMSVGSTIDGDSSNSGVSIDGGTGQAGTGASFLTLTFEAIPEPGTVALSLLALVGFGAVGMRSRLG